MMLETTFSCRWMQNGKKCKDNQLNDTKYIQGSDPCKEVLTGLMEVYRDALV